MLHNNCIDYFLILQLEVVSKELDVWRGKLAQLHSQYDWLLLLSVPKVLRLYNLLQSGSPVPQIAAEISHLFQNDLTARNCVQSAVKVSTDEFQVYNA